MAVPDSGNPISLSRVFREIYYCDYVGTNGIGGYGSNGAIPPVSLKDLDSSTSLRFGETNKGDGVAPYALSEWYSYSDLIPDVLYFEVEMSEAVGENPTYRVRFQTGSHTRQVFLTGNVNNTTQYASGTVGFTSGTFVSITVDRTAPDSTVADATTIQWYSRTDPCTAGGSTLDKTNTYSFGQSVVSANNYYSSVNVHSTYTVLIGEG
jgi:hypothetical protein